MRRACLAACALAAVAGCSPAATASAPAHPTSVTLRIHHSHFTPMSFSVAGGTTVRIIVRNTDPIDHELIVGDQATQDRHEQGTDARHDGSVPGEVSVPAGSVVVTSYRFGPPGRLLYGCHLPGHWAYGMHGIVHIS